MRTTINFQPATHDALTAFLTTYEQVYNMRVSPSEFVDDAVRYYLNMARRRLPRPGEGAEEMLLRRAAELRQMMESPSITEDEVTALMGQAQQLRSDCETVFLRRLPTTPISVVEAYQRTSQAALDAYNAGAMRLNEPRVAPAVRACPIEGGGEVWVRIHRTAAGFPRIVQNLVNPQAAALGVTLGSMCHEDAGWLAFQLMIHPRLPEDQLRPKVEHLVFPLKVQWETPDDVTSRSKSKARQPRTRM